MCIPLLFFGSSKFLNKEIESSILNTKNTVIQVSLPKNSGWIPWSKHPSLAPQGRRVETGFHPSLRTYLRTFKLEGWCERNSWFDLFSRLIDSYYSIPFFAGKFCFCCYKKQRVRLGQCSNTKKQNTSEKLQTRCMGQIGRTVGHRFSCLVLWTSATLLGCPVEM